MFLFVFQQRGVHSDLKPLDLLEDRIRDAQPEEAASGRTILGRVVQFVFGECEPTAARKMGVIANALGLLGAVGFLAIG